jgi:hypothetical protein
VCLIAWDATAATVDDIALVARRLLDSGAVYVCAWGPDCERVHDIVDEEHVGSNPSEDIDRVALPTWHDDGPLAEAILFLLSAACPHELYAAGCDSTVGLVIGSSEWTAEVRKAFAKPRAFVRTGLGRRVAVKHAVQPALAAAGADAFWNWC